MNPPAPQTSAGSVGQVRCLAVSEDGRWLAAGHSQGTVTTLDLRTGGVLATWRAHEAEVRRSRVRRGRRGSYEVI